MRGFKDIAVGNAIAVIHRADKTPARAAAATALLFAATPAAETTTTFTLEPTYAVTGLVSLRPAETAAVTLETAALCTCLETASVAGAGREALLADASIGTLPVTNLLLPTLGPAGRVLAALLLAIHWSSEVSALTVLLSVLSRSLLL